jgi:hypothetical protein
LFATKELPYLRLIVAAEMFIICLHFLSLPSDSPRMLQKETGGESKREQTKREINAEK